MPSAGKPALKAIRIVDRRIEWIVVHHCGAIYDWRKKLVRHQSFEEIKRYHMKPEAEGGKGYLDIGYHRFIERDGRIRFGRAENKIGAGVHKFNDYTLHVCVSGHADFEPFNDLQLASLVQQCAAWCLSKRLSASRVIGHRETDEHGGPKVFKTCPGVLTDMDKIRELVANVLQNPPPAAPSV